MSGSVFRRTPSQPVAPPPAAPEKGSIFRKAGIEKIKAEQQKPQTALPGNYEISDEDLERQSEKGIATALSRIGEGVISVPGNIGRLLDKVTGGYLGPLAGGAKNLPTSEEVKKFAEEKSGGYLKSEGELNKIADEYLTDVGGNLPFAGAGSIPGTLARRGLGAVHQGIRLFQPFVSPLIGQTAKQAIKSSGGTETKQDWGKVGTQIFFDVVTNRGRGSSGLINHLYDEANNALKGGAFAETANLRHAVLNLRKMLGFGGSSPTKTAALNKIEEVLGKIRPDGTMDVRDIVAFRKDFNALRDSLGGWQSELPKNLKREAIHNLENVKRQVINAGMEYGEKHNPAFSKNWSAANEASNIRSRSNIALRSLETFLPAKTLGKILGGALGTHALHAGAAGTSVLGPIIKTGIVSAPVITGGSTAYNLAKVGYRISRSPTLREYYKDLMTAAIRQDGPAISKAAAKIEGEMNKDDEKEKKLINDILK